MPKKYNNDIYINMVLDRSGSMTGIWEATKKGFNDYVKDQKAEKGDGWMTLHTFDDEIERKFEGLLLTEVPKLTDKITKPRGSTALYDAIGIALDDAEEWVKDNSDFKGHVLTVIVTDGYENASKKYNKKQIVDRIRKSEKKGWVTVYLGANQDAWANGGGLGVSYRGQTMSFDANYGSTVAASASNSISTSLLRSTGNYQDLSVSASMVDKKAKKVKSA